MEAAFEEVGPDRDAELERCGELLSRKFQSAELSEMKVRAKAFRFLVSRGFDSGVVERAISVARAGE